MSLNGFTDLLLTLPLEDRRYWLAYAMAANKQWWRRRPAPELVQEYVRKIEAIGLNVKESQK